MKVRIPIAVLAAVAVIAAILIFSSGGRTGGALDPVAQAAETTMHAGGAHMSFIGTVTVSNVASPITFSGKGSFNFTAHEGNLTLTMTGFPVSVSSKLHGDSLQMTELFKSASIYIGSPLFAGKLPGGARWLRLNVARLQQAVGLDPGSLTSGGANPAQYLQYLKDAGGSSTIVGQEAVRGVATTHYKGKIDLLKAAEAQPGSSRVQLRAAFDKLISETGLRSLPVGVWVDGHGVIRKVSLALSVAASGQRATATIQSEYYDFGSTPSISPPTDSEVFDMTQQELQNLAPGG